MRSDKSNFRQEVVHGLLAVAMLLISLSFSIKVYADDNVPTYTESQLDDATAYVRKQLIDRKTDFSLTIELSNADIALTEAQTTELQNVKSDSAKFSSAVSKISEDALKNKINYGWDILDKAMAHTGVAREGDYLKNNINGEYGFKYSKSMSVSADLKTVTVASLVFVYHVDYFTTAAQEATFEAEAAKVLSSLGVAAGSKLTDYEKVCKIYSYIAENVTYDQAHVNDDSYTIKQSAYAALVDKTAVCQGYASLFYYMCLQAGLDNRIIKGYSANPEGGKDPEFHAWNMVKVDDKFYYGDVTWDSESGEYKYFLEGTKSNGFDDHTFLGIDKIKDENSYDKPEDLYSNISEASYFGGKTRTELKDAAVTVSNAVYDDGKCTADVTVVFGGKTLYRGIDYKVDFVEFTHDKGKKEGKCSLNITGINLYQNTMSTVCDMTDVSANSDDSEDKSKDDEKKNSDKDKKDSKDSKNKKSDDKKDEKTEGSAESDDYIVYATFGQDIKKGYTLSIGEYKYKVTKAGKGGTLTYLGSKKKQKKIIIPDAISMDGVMYNVTAVNSKAFKGNTKLTSITIGKNVKKIGSKAFYGCRKLSSIEVRATGLKSVGSKAFKDIKTKVKVTVPKGKLNKYKKLLKKKGVSNKAKYITK